MEIQTGVWLIIGVCAIVLVMGALKKRVEWLMNFVMRSVLGTVAIYFINSALAGVGITMGVGVNIFTVLTTGILGFPGLLALYGISIFRTL